MIVPSAAYYVGLKLTLGVRMVFLDILVSLSASMSKFLLVHFNKYIHKIIKVFG